MELRPCIDIHNGKVKQIVGITLSDEDEKAKENFVSERDADFFAKFYEERGISGGHVIMLNKSGTENYEKTKAQALLALHAFPGGLQIGGGINADNAMDFIKEGASHVIVTSYVFSNGRINYDNLDKLRVAVGKERVVLDISCRRKNDNYYVVTDRWQTFTDEEVDLSLLEKLSDHCDEFLIHAVDAEGKSEGIDERLVKTLGKWKGCPVTYAGGIKDYDDIHRIKELSEGRLNITIGSALDLFGGPLNFETVLQLCVSGGRLL
ncbi:MAG: phosphoribosylformimino-5-aminoimidazole carboxamide ribotide isomerase [Lachnospiraceae bacterium]|nr:phosphoribosylformimino-5-aminoimidazole carboxamide ribotide isomerase [Lachnospiraceae bacterium]